MSGKRIGWWAAWVLVAELLVPVAARAEAPCDCPGGSYAPCHYNFPLLWRLSSHLHFHWNTTTEAPPPFSVSYYEFRSHCPYAYPTELLGFPSITLRGKAEARESARQ